MSTVNVRDGVMQMVNSYTGSMKADIMNYLDKSVAENKQLRNENKKLQEENRQLRVANGKLETRVDMLEMMQGLDKPTLTKALAVEPKKLLKEGVVDEDLFITGRLNDGAWSLYFQETLDRLYEHVGLAEKEGTIHPSKRPVLLIAKDVSGSMGVEEKYLLRCIAAWTTEILTRKYGKRVIVRYVNFHTEAKEVNEDVFLKGGERGGTIASSAGKLLNLIADEYDYGSNDEIYTLFLSDGDNLTSDNQRLMQEFNRLSVKSKKVWYAEANIYKRSSTILTALKALERKGELRTFNHIFTDRGQVLNVLNRMFREGERN
ncbi:YhbH-like sporulation related protein [Bacillus phage Thurquoise]|nr:YhbH-like sporulation related protein [Bacillus phage Thurquoise]